ncbi:hypothetical protein F5890DRAFT_1418456 [Lentinula detonsa]|uniref:DNA breaking-rejoining enzyme n=1 Tax=Lentinula detonsa TaxID=2804962 RepID=A0AA38PSS6_9AGAR|nr:hypothetical protein F5890DRAFT_1418456 [Lentinula detonsa]
MPSLDSASTKHQFPPPLPAPRRPKPGNEIVNNPFRPNVHSVDRLHAWTTPYSQEKRLKDSKHLHPAIYHSAELLWSKGIVDVSKSNYAAGLLRFSQFCDRMGVSEKDRMPASEVLISGFMGSHSGNCSGPTMRAWLSGLRQWHILHGAPWHGDTPRVSLGRRTANIEGAHRRRPQRLPVTTKHLHILHAALDFTLPFHCSIWALACLAFWSCRRLGELTVPSSNKFDPHFHVSRNIHISFTSSPFSHGNFHIPWTKTTKELGADISFTGREDALCPYKALKLHLSHGSNIPDSSSLFAFHDQQNVLHHMTKKHFLNFVLSIWAKAGTPNIHGHSFHIGGAVELLLIGVPPHIVAQTGGWTSLAFLLYWCRIVDLLPLHTHKAYSDDQWSKTRTAIEQYKKSSKISDSTINACIADTEFLNLHS